MVERLIILKNDDLNNEDGTKNGITKSSSFNTDDDDSLPVDSLPQAEDDSPKIPKSDTGLLKLDEMRRSLFLLSSPSIDSVNDPEGSISDNPISEKIKKKKQRRTTEKSDILDLRNSYTKKRPWYTKIDCTKPLIFVVLLFLIYFTWVKRDVWIPRLLTSNTRLRHTAIRIEAKLNETNSSSLLSSNEDDIIDDKKNKMINDQISTDDSDEDSPTISKPTSQKLNLRVRRNKISFSKEHQTKKGRRSRNQIIDDDTQDDDDDDDDDVPDNDNDELTIEPIQEKDPILPSSIHSSRKHHHHHRRRSDEQTIKSPTSSKTTLILHPHDDIIQQLQKLVKSRNRHGDLLTTIAKETGLSKRKLNRFIYAKDYSVITLDTFISFLKSFDSTLLIVPK